MKDIRNYLAMGATALATAGCMTPTPTNQRVVLDGREYSGATNAQETRYLIQTSEKNVTYSVGLTGKAQRQADTEKTFYAIETVKDNSGRTINSMNLTKGISIQDVEDLKTGKKSLDQVLGNTINIPGIGKAKAIQYRDQKVFILCNGNTKANFDEKGHFVLYGDFAKVGEGLNQTQFENRRNPVQIPKTIPQEEPKVLIGEPVEQYPGPSQAVPVIEKSLKGE